MLLCSGIRWRQARGGILVVFIISVSNWPRLASTLQELALRFRWAWEEAPTFEPYQPESLSAAELLVGGRASALVRSLRAAVIVLKSLNSNARSVFRILVDQQLKLVAESEGAGMW